MPSARRRLVSLAAIAAAGLACATPAHAAGFSSGLTSGGLRLPRGAHPLGRISGSTEVRATVTLSPRDPAALAAYAGAVSTPDSSAYHRYLSVTQFTHRFAPSAGELRAVRARLRRRGLTVGTPSANDLSLPVRATAAVAADAFSTEIVAYRAADGHVGYATDSPQALGDGLGTGVQGVVGLTSVAPTTSLTIRRARSAGPVHADVAAAPQVATGPAVDGPQACATAAETAAANGVNTGTAVADHYGLDDFYAAGDEGQGETIALYELEPFSPADVAAYQACYGTSATVEIESIDGGAGTGAGSGEAAMDVEDLIGLAPKATVRVYEGPPDGSGAYDTYSQIVADDAAQVISTSWGLCEQLEGAAGEEAENTLLQEAAVQGQTFIAATGDLGADDCADDQRAVDDPSSQPYATAVGGTSIQSSGDDVTWNNALGAGGGGASQQWAQPSYQAGFAQAQSAVTCDGSTTCRETPDISADADPNTGYLAYWRGGWQIVGGTSVAAPTIAALAALTDASPVCGGRSLGFLNPALYSLAAGPYAGTLHDITSGDNTFDSVVGFYAGSGYDMASGLGTPGAGLGPALCGDSVTLSTPAGQSWATGTAASLQLSASSTDHAAISFSATGLPAGVTIASSGKISGTPTAAGSYPVTVEAVDAGGAAAQAGFTISVTKGLAAKSTSASSGSKDGSKKGSKSGSGPGSSVGGSGASVSTASAHGISVARPTAVAGRLGVRVHVKVKASDQSRLALRFSADDLPRGLSIDARTGVISGTPRIATDRVVHVRARDAKGAASVAFRWTVAGLPQVTVRSAGVAHGGAAHLALVVHGGRYGPAVHRIVITAPAGAVRFAAARRQIAGVAIVAGGATVRVTTQARRSAHIVPRPSRVRLPALAAHLRSAVRGSFSARRLTLHVAVTDATGVVTRLTIKV